MVRTQDTKSAEEFGSRNLEVASWESGSFTPKQFASSEVKKLHSLKL